jgi:hypothetical protein
VSQYKRLGPVPRETTHRAACVDCGHPEYLHSERCYAALPNPEDPMQPGVRTYSYCTCQKFVKP